MPMTYSEQSSVNMAHYTYSAIDLPAPDASASWGGFQKLATVVALVCVGVSAAVITYNRQDATTAAYASLSTRVQPSVARMPARYALPNNQPEEAPQRTALKALQVDSSSSESSSSTALIEAKKSNKKPKPPIPTVALGDQTPDEAYAQVEDIMQEYAKTFYLGSKFFSLEKRKAIWAIYVWCRRTDEIVDGPNVSEDSNQLLAELKVWESRLDDIFDGKPQDIADYALAASLQTFPTAKQPYLDMIEGMRMDLPEVGQNRYQTWEDLYVYCYRVASTVGLMTMPVMGVAKDSSMEQATPPAVALGIALQITNILRDVGEDMRDRGRIYLPLDDMARFGVTEQQIKDGVVDDNYRNLMKFEIQRARDYYALARTGVPMLSDEGRMPVQSSLDLYSQILDSIEANDYDNFSTRAYVSDAKKLMTLPLSWLRTWGIPI